MIRFANAYFLLLIIPVIYLFFSKFQKNQDKSLKFSNVEILKKHNYKKTIIHKLSRYLIFIGIILLIIALARPQSVRRDMSLSQSGIDIAIALDISGSMDNTDLFPNRIIVAKDYLKKFIKKRPYDRFALVVFGGDAYTRIPLTLDHDVVLDVLNETTQDDISDSHTAIGMAMAVGINRLKDSKAENKVMILITDGTNNDGSISPNTATELAVSFGIKVYTIGVGSGDKSYNERLLKKIADKTGANFFRASEPALMGVILNQIDKLEKTIVTNDNHELVHEHAFLLINIALLLLLIVFVLDKVIFIKIP